MKIIQYKDYNEYKDVQIKANMAKIDRVFAQEDVIKEISSWLKKNILDIKFGICHGTRRGLEQEWFSNFLACDVIGTEISPTAKDFKKTIEWDFNIQNEEWIGKFDFVYSNSLDHSLSPSWTLEVWRQQLNKQGVLILEWHHSHNLPNQISDPFSASLEEYFELLTKLGMKVIETIKIKDRTILFIR